MGWFVWLKNPVPKQGKAYHSNYYNDSEANPDKRDRVHAKPSCRKLVAGQDEQHRYRIEKQVQWVQMRFWGQK